MGGAGKAHPLAGTGIASRRTPGPRSPECGGRWHAYFDGVVPVLPLVPEPELLPELIPLSPEEDFLWWWCDFLW